jgi:putative transcriptional regulator
MKKTRLLSEVHETARGLARIGAIDKHTLRDLDALCLPPVRELSAKQIRAIRSRTQMSQAVFAAVLNTSVSTVKKWRLDLRRLPVFCGLGARKLSSKISLGRLRSLGDDGCPRIDVVINAIRFR